MAGDRKGATKLILDTVEEIAPGSGNRERLEAYFKTLSDKQFEALMDDFTTGKRTVQLKVPNLSKTKLDASRNVKIGKKLGYDFFQRLRLTDPATGTTYLTPHKYMILTLPMRRQSQLLAKKMSIPNDNSKRDDLSGQPTGPSKGSTLSFPELQVLTSMGLDRSVEELLKVRGGDIKAFNMMNRSIIQSGGASLDSIAAMGTEVRSTQSFSAYLKAMHLDNQL